MFFCWYYKAKFNTTGIGTMSIYHWNTGAGTIQNVAVLVPVL